MDWLPVPCRLSHRLQRKKETREEGACVCGGGYPGRAKTPRTGRALGATLVQAALLAGNKAPSCPIQGHLPVLVVSVFLVETFIVGLHVAQAGIVIGINKGQMNLGVEKAEAEGRGWDPVKELVSWG